MRPKVGLSQEIEDVTPTVLASVPRHRPGDDANPLQRKPELLNMTLLIIALASNGVILFLALDYYKAYRIVSIIEIQALG